MMPLQWKVHLLDKANLDNVTASNRESGMIDNGKLQ